MTHATWLTLMVLCIFVASFGSYLMAKYTDDAGLVMLGSIMIFGGILGAAMCGGQASMGGA